MKTLIFILILAAFLQTTILPLELVLLILTCRAYLKEDKNNLYLAFGLGLLVSHLSLAPLGLQSILYMSLVTLTGSLSKLRLAANPLLIIPVSLLVLMLNQAAISVINGSGMDFSGIIYASILSLPIFYILRAWEERFIVRKDIKLKV